MSKDLSKLVKVWSAAILLGLLLMIGLRILDGNNNRLGTVQIQLED